MGVLWGKIWEGVVWTNSFFLLGVFTSVPILVKIDQEMRPWECSQTDRYTDRQTQTDFMICPMLYAMGLAMGQIIIIRSRTVSELGLSQLIVQILDTLRFWAIVWGLGNMYDVNLELIGKRVLDFLLVLMELCSLGVTAEALRAKIDKTRSFATAKSTSRPLCLVGVLYDIYLETINRSAANQPLLRNWPWKLPISAK